MTKDDFQFQLEMGVRDYECDMQGIVNNSVYQNYMEHTRHEFIKTMGLDFAQLTADDVIVVVARIEIAFKNSLVSGDKFESCAKLYKSGVKYMFEQAIFNAETGQVVATGKVTTVARINGKLSHAPMMDEAVEKLNK